jgi:hypothetical protein
VPRVAGLLVVSLVALFGLTATDAGAVPHHAKAKGGKIIVFPKRGEVVNANVARISIRAGRGLHIRLNGKWIPAKEFGRARRGVRTMQASISHGLRAGTNTLTVKLRRHGHRRRATVRFRVEPPAPMAGAGRDQTATTGGEVVLAGKIEPGAPPAKEAITWTPIRLPEAEGNDCPAPQSQTRLQSPDGLTAKFRPQLPGTYVFRMTAKEDGRTVSDTVSVDNSSPNRMVPIETMIGSGPKAAGIKVGRYTYRWSEAGGPSNTGLQMLVLSRHNLECISNTRYASAAELEVATKKLKDDELAIVAIQPGIGTPSTLHGTELYGVLRSIGFPTEKSGTLPVGGGMLSGIGNIRLEVGEGDVDVLPSGSTEEANMVGYLAPDQYNNFGFIPSKSEKFSLLSRGDNGCSNQADCESKTGYYLRVLNGRTLAPGPGDKTFFATGVVANSTQAVTHLTETLEKVPVGDVVELETRSERVESQNYLPPVGPIEKGLMVRFANAIAGLGGTKNGINKTARLNGDVDSYGLTYALVGWQGAKEGEGAESAEWVDGAGVAAGIAGVLRPNQRSLMRPAEESSLSGPENLADVVMEPPKNDWPLDGDAGAMKAFDYLASTDRFEKLGENPRKSYWSLDLEAPMWRNIAAEYTPAAGNEAEKEEQRRYEEVPKAHREAFTLKQYMAAKAELWQELEWVATTREYLKRLSQPFSENGIKSYVTVQEIGDRIYKESTASDASTSLEWVEFTSIMLKLLGPLTFHTTNTVGELLDLGVWAFGSTPEGRPTYAGVSIRAHELGTALMKQMESTVGTYRAMGNVIVSDPAKLKEIGRHGGCNPEKGSCPTGFAFNDEMRLRLSADISRAAQRLSYEKLIPLAYSTFKLRRPHPGGETKAPDPQNYRCGFSSGSPWEEFSPLAREKASATLLEELDPKSGQNGYQVLMMARPPGNHTKGEAPKDGLLKKMYEPVSEDNNAAVGGLGMSPEEFLGGEEWELWAPNHDRPPTDACYWEN